ncbi:FMN reductase [Nocardioides speluncae]|uniref:FMN reductase n=1 Tax=Nocardioides speluncae TaxID=2670337 RepID=UPI000D68F546|nr:FMN reductase [Nocardioides speluncae]
MTRRIVVVTAGLSTPSSTRILADQLAAATAGALRTRGEQVQVDVIELRALARPLADNLVTGFPSGELAAAVGLLRQADALIAVTPVFSASYSGLFKTFFDVLEPDLLAGLPVLMAATGGTARHSMVLDHALRPLFNYLKALPVPTGVYAATEDFGNTADGALAGRVERAAAELANAVTAAPIATRPRTLADEFDEPTPFEDLLKA